MVNLGEIMELWTERAREKGGLNYGPENMTIAVVACHGKGGCCCSDLFSPPSSNPSLLTLVLRGEKSRAGYGGIEERGGDT